MNIFNINKLKNIFQKLSFSILITLFLTFTITTIFPRETLASDVPKWSYGGAYNPTHWSEIDNKFSQCGLGKSQSPIDIENSVKTSDENIEFNYNSTPLEIVNNGRTILVKYEEGSFVKINGQEYQLLQFHFHTPSEHTIKEKAFAMEMHLVHSNTLGQLAVVGVMIEESGNNNSILDTIWENIPQEIETNKVENVTINVKDILPNNHSYYSYSGSLTTPPCSEDVSWNILTEPIELSVDNINKFQNIYQVNARSIQPLNERIIEVHQ